MKIACCITQTKDGKYLKDWVAAIELRVGKNVDFFLHYMGKQQNTDIQYVDVSSSNDLDIKYKDLYGMMRVNLLKEKHELNSIFHYELCIHINIDYPVPEYIPEKFDNIEMDCLYLDIYHKVSWPMEEKNKASYMFFYGDTLVTSLYSKCYAMLSLLDDIFSKYITDISSKQKIILYAYINLVFMIGEDINYEAHRSMS